MTDDSAAIPQRASTSLVESRPTVRSAPRLSLVGQTFRSLRHRDFRLLWFGTFFSGSGQWIQQATIGWLTYQLTGSPFLLGAVNGFRSLPMLLLAPFAGVAADRFERKRIMLTTQVSLVIATATFATIIVTGRLEVWHLFAFTLLTGVGWTFNMPVRHSVVPNLVPRQDLMNAMALNSAGFNLSRILGPTMAGILIATVGAGENFYIQSAAYIGVTLMVIQANIPTASRSASHSVRANLLEGAQFIWRHPTLRAQMTLALAPVVIALPYSALLPIFARDVLQVGPEGFGLLMAAAGLGAVIGTLTLASLGSFERKGQLLLASVFMLGISLILFSFSRSFPLSLLLLVVAGAVQMVYFTTNQTLIQLTTPDELRGRVMGVYMLNQGLLPLGSLFAGALADLLDAPTAVLIMGSLVALMALAFAARAPSLRAS